MMRYFIAIGLLFWLMGIVFPNPIHSKDKEVVVVEKAIATVLSTESIFIFIDCNGKETIKDKETKDCPTVERQVYKNVVKLSTDDSTLGYISKVQPRIGDQLIAERDDKGNWIIH